MRELRLVGREGVQNWRSGPTSWRHPIAAYCALCPSACCEEWSTRHIRAPVATTLGRMISASSLGDAGYGVKHEGGKKARSAGSSLS